MCSVCERPCWRDGGERECSASDSEFESATGVPRTHIMGGAVRLCLAESINGEVCQRVAGHGGKHGDLKGIRWKDGECKKVGQNPENLRNTEVDPSGDTSCVTVSASPQNNVTLSSPASDMPSLAKSTVAPSATTTTNPPSDETLELQTKLWRRSETLRAFLRSVTPTAIARAVVVYNGEYNRLRGHGDEQERAMRAVLNDFLAGLVLRLPAEPTEEHAEESQRLDWIEAHGLPDSKVYDGCSLRQAVDSEIQNAKDADD